MYDEHYERRIYKKMKKKMTFIFLLSQDQFPAKPHIVMHGNILGLSLSVLLCGSCNALIGLCVPHYTMS